MIINDTPVICAECKDTGEIIALRDGHHLTCALMKGKPIYGSKPTWCPKGELYSEDKKGGDYSEG